MAQKKGKTFPLNHVMCINRAAVENMCEDSYALSMNNDYAMIAVFDGCGGLGAKKYFNYENHTAAYIAARAASWATLNWFETRMPCDQRGINASEKQIVCSLKEALDENFGQVSRTLDKDEIKLSGSLIRSFPTTASIAIIDSRKVGELKCTFLWAGDSRGFILQPDGLKQCTKDDLRIDEDPFENLYADSPLSNIVNGEGRYNINGQRIVCKTPAIVFTATDGTFGYLPSPMHYEWMIIRTLCTSESFTQWEERLNEEIASVTGDDSTLTMAVYGWKSFRELKASFEPRERMLRRELDHEQSIDYLRSMWQSYKTEYLLYAGNNVTE